MYKSRKLYYNKTFHIVALLYLYKDMGKLRKKIISKITISIYQNKVT